MYVWTLSIRETISAQCGSRSDPWSIEILTRLDCIDFVSEEGLDHRSCYVKFMCTFPTSKPVESSYVHVFGREGTDISNTFTFVDDEKDKTALLTEKYEAYSTSNKNIK